MHTVRERNFTRENRLECRAVRVQLRAREGGDERVVVESSMWSRQSRAMSETAHCSFGKENVYTTVNFPPVGGGNIFLAVQSSNGNAS